MRYTTTDSLVLVDQASRATSAPPSYPAIPAYHARCRRTGQHTTISRSTWHLLELLRDPHSKDEAIGILATEQAEALWADALADGLIQATGEIRSSQATWHCASHCEHLNGIPFAPTVVTWMATAKCQMHCLHCVNQQLSAVSTPIDSSRELDTTTVLGLLEQMGELSVSRLEISGGEPLLRKDMLQLLEAASKQPFDTTLFSNGMLLNPDWITKLKALDERGVGRLRLHLSIDGGSARSHDWLRDKAGSFNKLRLLLQQLKEQDYPASYVETMATSRGLEDFRSLAALCAATGVKNLHVHPPYTIGDISPALRLDAEQRLAWLVLAEELRWQYEGAVKIKYEDVIFPTRLLDPVSDKERRLELLEHFFRLAAENATKNTPSDQSAETGLLLNSATAQNCAAAIQRLTISPYGEAFPCVLYADKRKDCAGNIRGAGLLELWKSEALSRAREPLTRDNLKTCSACPQFERCGARMKKCRIGAELAHGDFNGPPPLCVEYAGRLGIPDSLIARYRQH